MDKKKAYEMASYYDTFSFLQFKAAAKAVLAAKRFTKFGSMENGK